MPDVLEAAIVRGGLHRRFTFETLTSPLDIRGSSHHPPISFICPKPCTVVVRLYLDVVCRLAQLSDLTRPPQDKTEVGVSRKNEPLTNAPWAGSC